MDANASNQRFTDTKDQPLRKLNLDRRVPPADRRIYADPRYRGPCRRLSIESRRNEIDRRESLF